MEKGALRDLGSKTVPGVLGWEVEVGTGGDSRDTVKEDLALYHRGAGNDLSHVLLDEIVVLLLVLGFRWAQNNKYNV